MDTFARTVSALDHGQARQSAA